MSIIRINQAIAIMERAKAHNSIDMDSFQAYSRDGFMAVTEAEFHTCGNKACFAGHIAVSPEFQADGGSVNIDGKPVFSFRTGHSAISEWLGITNDTADAFVYGLAFYIPPEGSKFFSKFYQKYWYKVNAQDVIDKLIFLRDNGEDKMLEYIKSL